MYLQGQETERLRFEPIKHEDANLWETYFENNSNLEYLGLELISDIPLQAKEWVGFQLKRYEEDRFGLHAIIDKTTNSYIGHVGLITQNINDTLELEVGYHILPEHWRKGYASEAAIHCMKYGFENTDFESIISVIQIDNIGSQKVARNNGLKVDESIHFHGLECEIFRIYKSDWIAMK